jgi:hypothetical protein
MSTSPASAGTSCASVAAASSEAAVTGSMLP